MCNNIPSKFKSETKKIVSEIGINETGQKNFDHNFPGMN